MLILPTLKYQKREIVSTQKGFAMPQSDPYTGKPDGQGARYFTAKVANDRRGGSRSRCFFSFLRQVSRTTGSRWWQHEGRNGTEGKHSNPPRSLHIPPSSSSKVMDAWFFPPKNYGPQILPTQKWWIRIFLRMMDPDGSNGDAKAEPMCHNCGAVAIQVSKCGIIMQ